MYCLEASDLFHRYSNHDVVLDGINMRVPEGGIYGFLGPNGAGKTTTLRLLLGLLRRQQGNISIFGRRFDRHRVEILGRVGSMIESPSSYDHLDATENLAVLRCVHRCPKQRITEVLAQVGLAGTRHKKVRQFSLGMKQRLGIAMALLHQPRLLILDEPTNGLDANGMVEIRQLLGRLSQEDGITIVLSSHLLAEIEKMATHVGIIGRGRMVYEGTLAELRQRQQPGMSLSIRTSDDRQALEVLTGLGVFVVTASDGLALPAMPDGDVANLNRQLLQAGIDVYAIGARGRDLESIYLDMIGERCMIAIAGAFQGEWLKTRHSLAWWLVLGGSLFTPLVIIVARLVQHRRLANIYAAADFWPRLWQDAWQSMAIFFLPLFAILVTSLVTQIEHRNNAWKQVHVLPLGLGAIFLSKLGVIVLLILQFFVLFNLGIWLSAVVPFQLIAAVPYPQGAIPLGDFLRDDAGYFVDCLPIIALQYLLGLRFRNFLVPLGIGFLLWIGALAALPWRFGYLVPYTYSMLDYLKNDPGKAFMPAVNIHFFALGYATAVVVAAYVLFRTMKERG